MLRPTDRRVSSREPCRSSRHAAPGRGGPDGRSRRRTTPARRRGGRGRGRRAGASSGTGPGARTPCATCSCGSCAATGGPDGRHERHRTLALARRRRAASLTASPLAGADHARDRRPARTTRSPSPSASPTTSTRSTRSWATRRAPTRCGRSTYDYLVGYSMTTCRRRPALADVLGHLRRRPDLDLPHPRGRAVVRRRAAHRGRRRLHLQPGARPRRSRASTWRSYLKTVDQRHRARRHDRRAAALSKPNATLPLLPIPILPEHIWKDVSKDQLKQLRQRADGRPAGRRVRAVPAGRGHRRRLDVPASRRTPTTGAASRTSTRSSSRSTSRRTRWCRR